MTATRAQWLERDLRERIDRDPDRPSVYVNRVTLREFLDTTKAEIERLRGVINAQKADFRPDGKWTRRRSQNARLNAKLQQAYAQHEQLRAELDVALDIARREFARLNADIATKDAFIATLKAERDGLRERISSDIEARYTFAVRIARGES